MEIYSFVDLKKFVENVFSIDVNKIKSKFEPPPKIRIEISKYELDETIEISEEGIFYTDENENRIKGFLYIPIYDPFLWKLKGWNTMPRFHITNCNVIEEQRRKSNFNGHYVFSNEAETNLEDVDGITKDILICGNCMSKVGILQKITSTIYVEEYLKNDEHAGYYQKEDLPNEVDVNEFGYTPDWELTSRLYRIKHRFTCENCGIKLNENYSDGYYLETHHINGNKTDNEESNLKCLCTLCHAYIDTNHYKNFSNYKNRRKLEQFVDSFLEKLKKIDNPCLKDYLNHLKR